MQSFIANYFIPMFEFSTTSARLAAIVFNDDIISQDTFDFRFSQNNYDLRNRVNAWQYLTGLTNPNSYGIFLLFFLIKIF
jgi:hypothetical protein